MKMSSSLNGDHTPQRNELTGDTNDNSGFYLRRRRKTRETEEIFQQSPHVTNNATPTSFTPDSRNPASKMSLENEDGKYGDDNHDYGDGDEGNMSSPVSGDHNPTPTRPISILFIFATIGLALFRWLLRSLSHAISALIGTVIYIQKWYTVYQKRKRQIDRGSWDSSTDEEEEDDDNAGLSDGEDSCGSDCFMGLNSEDEQGEGRDRDEDFSMDEYNWGEYLMSKGGKEIRQRERGQTTTTRGNGALAKKTSSTDDGAQISNTTAKKLLRKVQSAPGFLNDLADDPFAAIIGPTIMASESSSSAFSHEQTSPLVTNARHSSGFPRNDDKDRNRSKSEGPSHQLEKASAAFSAANKRRQQINRKIREAGTTVIAERELKITVGSWNVAQQPPPERFGELSEWLLGLDLSNATGDSSSSKNSGENDAATTTATATVSDKPFDLPDVVVIGLQEVELGGAALVFETTESKVAWTEAVIECLNEASAIHFKCQRSSLEEEARSASGVSRSVNSGGAAKGCEEDKLLLPLPTDIRGDEPPFASIPAVVVSPTAPNDSSFPQTPTTAAPTLALGLGIGLDVNNNTNGNSSRYSSVLSSLSDQANTIAAASGIAKAPADDNDDDVSDGTSLVEKEQTSPLPPPLKRKHLSNISATSSPAFWRNQSNNGKSNTKTVPLSSPPTLLSAAVATPGDSPPLQMSGNNNDSLIQSHQATTTSPSSVSSFGRQNSSLFLGGSSSSGGMTTHYRYKKVESLQLVGIVLIVIVRHDHYPHINHLHTALSRTGVRGIMGNKGAIGARFSLYGKRFLFLNAHFDASVKSKERRNANYRDAMTAMKFPSLPAQDDELDRLLQFAYGLPPEMDNKANSNGGSSGGGGRGVSQSTTYALAAGGGGGGGMGGRGGGMTQLFGSAVAGRSAFYRFFKGKGDMNKDTRASTAKESRTLTSHDYVFFFGDLNYRLNVAKSKAAGGGGGGKEGGARASINIAKGRLGSAARSFAARAIRKSAGIASSSSSSSSISGRRSVDDDSIHQCDSVVEGSKHANSSLFVRLASLALRILERKEGGEGNKQTKETSELPGTATSTRATPSPLDATRSPIEYSDTLLSPMCSEFELKGAKRSRQPRRRGSGAGSDGGAADSPMLASLRATVMNSLSTFASSLRFRSVPSSSSSSPSSTRNSDDTNPSQGGSAAGGVKGILKRNSKEGRRRENTDDAAGDNNINGSLNLMRASFKSDISGASPMARNAHDEENGVDDDDDNKPFEHISIAAGDEDNEEGRASRRRTSFSDPHHSNSLQSGSRKPLVSQSSPSLHRRGSTLYKQVQSSSSGFPMLMPVIDVRQFVKDGRLSELLETDQLSREMARGRIFRGFHEQPINFAPTYKFDKGTRTYDTSYKRRDPAWTDRVLYWYAPEGVMAQNPATQQQNTTETTASSESKSTTSLALDGGGEVMPIIGPSSLGSAPDDSTATAAPPAANETTNKGGLLRHLKDNRYGSGHGGGKSCSVHKKRTNRYHFVRNHVDEEGYEAAVNTLMSDHRPIAARFTVTAGKPIEAGMRKLLMDLQPDLAMLDEEWDETLV